MGTASKPDIDAVAFETVYADHLAGKSNYDSAGNELGALPTSLISSNYTAEYGDLVDDLLAVLLWRGIGGLRSANEDGLRDATSDAQRATAIQAAIDAAAANGGGVLIPAGTWVFNAQLTNPTAVPIVCMGELQFSGSGADAIVIGGSAAAVQYDSSIQSVIRLSRSTVDYSDAFAGVSLVNVFEGNYSISVEGFETGLRLTGEDAGCVYNRVTLGRMYNNLVAVDLLATGTGWCNENTFSGGRIASESATSTSSDVIGFRLRDVTSVSGPNGNKFIGNSIELNNAGAGYTAAFRGVGDGPISFNEAIALRAEGNDYLLAGTALIDNRFGLAFGMTNPALAADLLSGDTADDQLELQRNRFASSRAIGSSEPAPIARFGANNVVAVSTNVTRPARGVAYNENTGTFADVTPGTRDGDVVTLTSSSIPLGFVLDLRNADRDFERVAWLKTNLAATGGRWVAAVWDSSYVELTGTDDAGPLSPHGNGGLDYYRSGADMSAAGSEFMLAFGDDVAFAFVGVANGSANAALRDFIVSVLPNSGIEILQDRTIYDAISSGSGIGSIDTEDAVALSEPSSPAANADYPTGMVVRDISGATSGWRWTGTAWAELASSPDTIIRVGFDAATSLVYLPLIGDSNPTASLTEGWVQWLAEVDVTVVDAVLHCINTNYGTTIVGTHIDENTTAADTDSQTLNTDSGNVTFTLGTDVDAGERLSISFDGQFSGGEVVGYIRVRPR